MEHRLDAGFVAALGKPIVTLYGADLAHALKEVDRAGDGHGGHSGAVVEILRYATVKE